jgi:hypothetical protein
MKITILLSDLGQAHFTNGPGLSTIIHKWTLLQTYLCIGSPKISSPFSIDFLIGSESSTHNCKSFVDASSSRRSPVYEYFSKSQNTHVLCFPFYFRKRHKQWPFQLVCIYRYKAKMGAEHFMCRWDPWTRGGWLQHGTVPCEKDPIRYCNITMLVLLGNSKCFKRLAVMNNLTIIVV